LFIVLTNTSPAYLLTCNYAMQLALLFVCRRLVILVSVVRMTLQSRHYTQYCVKTNDIWAIIAL